MSQKDFFKFKFLTFTGLSVSYLTFKDSKTNTTVTHNFSWECIWSWIHV